MGYVDLPSNAIRKQREKAGLSRAQLAKALGVKPCTLDRWETGESKITDTYVKRIARQLNCSLAELSGEIITRAEFEEVKAAIARIERKLDGHAAPRASIYVDPVEVCERLGLVDSEGEPVVVGCFVRHAGGTGPDARVHTISAKAEQNGKMTVSVYTSDSQAITAVDMRLPGHVVTRKATA